MNVFKKADWIMIIIASILKANHLSSEFFFVDSFMLSYHRKFVLNWNHKRSIFLYPDYQDFAELNIYER